MAKRLKLYATYTFLLQRTYATALPC